MDWIACGALVIAGIIAGVNIQRMDMAYTAKARKTKKLLADEVERGSMTVAEAHIKSMEAGLTTSHYMELSPDNDDELLVSHSPEKSEFFRVDNPFNDADGNPAAGNRRPAHHPGTTPRIVSFNSHRRLRVRVLPFNAGCCTGNAPPAPPVRTC